MEVLSWCTAQGQLEPDLEGQLADLGMDFHNFLLLSHLEVAKNASLCRSGEALDSFCAQKLFHVQPDVSERLSMGHDESWPNTSLMKRARTGRTAPTSGLWIPWRTP